MVLVVYLAKQDAQFVHQPQIVNNVLLLIIYLEEIVLAVLMLSQVVVSAPILQIAKTVAMENISPIKPASPVPMSIVNGITVI